MKNMLLLVIAMVVIGSFWSCEKDPEIITNTVTQIDTVFITQQDTIIIHATDTLILTELVQDTATTFILTRHAETESVGSDPILNAAGQARAQELARLLHNVPLNAVYSTTFNRTQQTATPAAADHGLTLQSYSTSNFGLWVNPALQNYKGGAVLVVGHSNTTPSLLNWLIGANTYVQIPESEYDNLYIVTVYAQGNAKVLHLKYGD